MCSDLLVGNDLATESLHSGHLGLALVIWVVLVASQVLAVAGSLSASSYPSYMWMMTKYQRVRWVAQVVAVLLPPLAWALSGTYFAVVRPALRRAENPDALTPRQGTSAADAITETIAVAPADTYALRNRLDQTVITTRSWVDGRWAEVATPSPTLTRGYVSVRRRSRYWNTGTATFLVVAVAVLDALILL